MQANCQTDDATQIEERDWVEFTTGHDAVDDFSEYRRTEPRFAVEFGTAKLDYVVDDEDGRRSVTRTLSVVELSAGGLTLRSHCDIAVGTELAIEVIIDDLCGELRGRIAHSTGTIGGFTVGVKLDFSGTKPPAPGK